MRAARALIALNTWLLAAARPIVTYVYCYLSCWYLSIACQINAMTTLVILSLYISGVLLFELSSSRVDGYDCPENDVGLRNQTELDRYLDDEISYRRKNNATRCIQWILTGSTYQLDMVKLMKINLQHRR